jgi:3-oxoadipate enol-lactonase
MHGIGGNRHNWMRQLQALADICHGVAWDARGYGDSGDYDGPLDFRDFAGDLARLLDHLGAARAHVCGLSMGGRIALDFWDVCPDRVASLILCDTVPGFDASFTREGRERFVNERRGPLLEGKELAPLIVSMTATGAPGVVVVQDTVIWDSLDSTFRSTGASGAGPNSTAANVDGVPARRRSDTPTAA